LDSDEKVLRIKSTKGTPINTIHGTRDIVKINVLAYNGKRDNCFPKKNRNRVMEG
jgi:hypothetical protein